MKALVTGATSGIGKSIARKLKARGWELILTGRNEEALASLKKELGDGVETIAGYTASAQTRAWICS